MVKASGIQRYLSKHGILPAQKGRFPPEVTKSTSTLSCLSHRLEMQHPNFFKADIKGQCNFPLCTYPPSGCSKKFHFQSLVAIF